MEVEKKIAKKQQKFSVGDSKANRIKVVKDLKNLFDGSRKK
jgi:hypothetical protein